MSGGPPVPPNGHPGPEQQFWPAPGQTSPPPEHSPDIDFTAPHYAPQRHPDAGRPNDGPGQWLRWVIPAIVLVVIAGLSGLYVWRLRGNGSDAGDSPTTSGHVLSRPAPPGWSQEIAWSHAVSSTPAIAVMSNRVAFLEGNRLTVLDADSGSTEFASPPVEVSPNASPIIARVEGRPVVGIQDGATLTLWNLPTPDGSPGERISLPLNAQVFGQNGGLLVTSGTESWRVNEKLELEPVSLPKDHVAVGVTGDGSMLSAPENASWMFTDTKGQRRVVRAEGKPDGTRGEMNITWGSRGVIAAWGEMRDPTRRSVALYEAEDGTMLAQGTLSAQQVADGLPLTVSEHGVNASAGPLLANLETGAVDVVPGWSTVMSNDRGLYGTVNGTRQFWSEATGPTELQPGAGVPWGVSNSGLAVMVDPTPEGDFAIVGLRPDPGRPR